MGCGLFLQRAQILVMLAFFPFIPQSFSKLLACLQCIRQVPDTGVKETRSLLSVRLLLKQAEQGKPHPPVTASLPQAHKTRLTLGVTTCCVSSGQGIGQTGKGGCKLTGRLMLSLSACPVTLWPLPSPGPVRKVRLDLQAKQDLERQDLELYVVHSWGI